MGQEIQRWQFTEADRAAFIERLTRETQQLAQWESDGAFTDAPTTVGYELEACLVDAQYRPADANEAFLERLGMSEVVPELARCNIEFNGQPHLLAGNGLCQLQQELDQWLNRAREVAQSLGLNILMIGILPTLQEEHLCLSHISDSNRYYAMNKALAEMRGHDKVYLDIRGPDLETAAGPREYRGEFDSIMAESATTSFQVHMRLPTADAAAWYNAALLASAPVLSVSANAPFMFGHDLWAETRIPVFAQSIDTGKLHYVSFGQGYLNTAMSEIFECNLRSFPPILPVCSDADGLSHLKLHNGTIWRWNRAIVDGDDSEQLAELHYRLEHRSLPSGPSTVDMVANAALFWGLMTALSNQPPGLSFRQARRNFYRAARDGMAARLLWIDGHEYPARELLAGVVLPMAREGLLRMDVNASVIQMYLDVIKARVKRGLSGAGWQRAWLRRHGGEVNNMLAAYEQNQWSGLPVAEWVI